VKILALLRRRFWGASRTSRALNCTALSLWLLFVTSGARADTILTYDFSTDTSTSLGGNTYLISGNFTIDTTSAKESDVLIPLTGSGPLAGDYTEPAPFPYGPGALAIAGFIESDQTTLIVHFVDLLSSSTDDPLAEVSYSCCSFSTPATSYTDTAPTGEAVATPEPSSAILLGFGLAILGFLQRRKLRRLMSSY
jgi:hypothetical protein